MKKFFPVIIGVIVGLALSVTMIGHRQNYRVEAVVNPFDIDVFEWNTVFSGIGKGQELYNLIYNKLLVFPEKDALKEVAGNYGLTVDEAKAVRDGSISTIFNNPNRRSVPLTQEEAYDIMRGLQEDYAEFKELFDLQQELDSALSPSEIFANGDLADSGFDLIYDLSVMEEILFLEENEVSVGGRFYGGPDTPFLPTEDENIQEGPYVEAGYALEGEGNVSADESEGTASATGLARGVDNEGPGDAGSPGLGNSDVIPELDKDICTDESGDDDNDNNGGNGGDGDGGSDSGNFEGGDDGSGNGDANSEGGSGDGAAASDGIAASDEEEGYELTDDEGKVQAAPADEWKKSWCPALEDPQAEATADQVAAVAGLKGLSTLSESLLSGALSGGAGAGVEVPGLTLAAAICFETELVYKTESSYYPGESCILCEVEQINELFSKTLSHSLIPNKVTGNLMESAKCKDAFSIPGIDMNFIALSAPVSTPLNDDVIFGKNIVEEWNKFIDRYSPLLLPKIDQYAELELATANPYESQEAIYNDIQSALAEEEAKAKTSVESYSIADVAGNNAIYTQTTLLEMKQMTAFFKTFLKLYEDMAKICQETAAKPDIQ